MAIALNPNEKLTCSCMCPVCGAGRSAYSNRKWGVGGGALTPPAHCKNQQAGCGFSTGQESVYSPY